MKRVILTVMLATVAVSVAAQSQPGLTGPYDFDLQWIPHPTLGPAAPQGSQGDGASLFTAIQEQLGLKLVATRGPVEVWSSIRPNAPPKITPVLVCPVSNGTRTVFLA